MAMSSLTFQLLPIGKPTANGRIYPKEVAESIVQQVKDKPDHILCFPASTKIVGIDTLPLHQACGVVKGAEIDGDAVVVSIQLLDTPPGKAMQDLMADIDAIGPFGVRSIGHGMLGEDNIVSEYVFTGTHFGPEELLNAPE